MLKRILLLPLGVCVLVAMLATTGTAGTRSESDGGTSQPTVDQGSALVQLKGAPLATSEKTKPAPGKKIDFSSTTTKSYRAQLNSLRSDFKAWLRANAPGAQVTGEFDIALNAVSVKLNGNSLTTIASAPMVNRAELQGIYRPAATDPDLALVNAIAGWGSGGPSNAGKGVEVAIVDSGIDITHPCFSDGNSANDGKFTNDRVIYAAVYNNKAGNKGYTPEDLNSHGTHVAGTVACNYQTPAVMNGATIGYAPSGVAPAARLGSFNVFPGDDGDARSEDILNALEDAYEMGFDVANMSLGGGSHGIQDLLSDGVDDLDEAGMVVAVAAGNSGPGVNTIESPGLAQRALTAGGIMVGHFLSTPVTTAGATFNSASGDLPTAKADLTATLQVVLDAANTVNGISIACNANKPAAGSLTGKIAVISRGSCTFSEKVRNAQDAGAVAALVVNNTGGDPTAMGLGGIANEPTIPAYMLPLSDAAGLKAASGSSATIKASFAYVQTANGSLHYNSTSRGPTDVDFRVKPDVVAPGVNVLSSQPAWTCSAPPCWAFFQGTSMATPHLAGAAAVVLSQHNWSAAQVRSAIVNTADQGVVKAANGLGALETNVNAIGAGRLNVASASGAKVALDPVSLSFGAVPTGSGRSLTQTITLSDLAGSGGTYSVSISSPGGGVTYSAPATVTVPAGGTATLAVTMSAGKGASLGPKQATLTLGSGSGVAHAVVFSWIK